MTLCIQLSCVLLSCILSFFTFLENANLSDFFRKSNAGEQLVVDPSIKAEVKFVMMLIKQNCLFNITDHLSPLIRNEFKGSDAAQSFHRTRTKTAAIVNCLGDYFFDKIKEDMKQWPYSLMLDGSNDNGIKKMFPVTVRIFDLNFNRIMTKFVDMNLIEGTDASTAYHSSY